MFRSGGCLEDCSSARLMVAMVVCQECDLKLLHLMDTEDGGSALLRNIGNYLPVDTS